LTTTLIDASKTQYAMYASENNSRAYNNYIIKLGRKIAMYAGKDSNVTNKNAIDTGTDGINSIYNLAMEANGTNAIARNESSISGTNDNMMEARNGGAIVNAKGGRVNSNITASGSFNTLMLATNKDSIAKNFGTLTGTKNVYSGMRIQDGARGENHGVISDFKGDGMSTYGGKAATKLINYATIKNF